MASRMAISRYASGKVTGASVGVDVGVGVGVTVSGGGVIVTVWVTVIVVVGGVVPHAQAGNIRVVVRRKTTNSHLVIW